jgi:trimeric autotransporter adhesin
LNTSLSNKASTTHASTHASGGSDVVTLAQSQVTNLTTDLSGKVALSTITAKGDLLVGSANSAINIIAVGTNNQLLTADSTQAYGIKWTNAPDTGDTGITPFLLLGV